MRERTNPEWMEDLQGKGQAEAIEDLRFYLLQGLQRTFVIRGSINEQDAQDFVQEALLVILEKKDSFQGKSRFTTWAMKIAINTVLNQLRKKNWQNIALQDMAANDQSLFLPQMIKNATNLPEQQAVLSDIFEIVDDVVQHELTPRQREAFQAMLHRVPMVIIAERMHSNPNAVYKLIHDARVKMRKRLLEANLALQDVMDLFS